MQATSNHSYKKCVQSAERNWTISECRLNQNRLKALNRQSMLLILDYIKVDRQPETFQKVKFTSLENKSCTVTRWKNLFYCTNWRLDAPSFLLDLEMISKISDKVGQFTKRPEKIYQDSECDKNGMLQE